MGKALIGLGIVILAIAFIGRMDYNVYDSTEEI